MSQILVAHYQREIAALVQHGGSRDEDLPRKAFSNLLDACCKPATDRNTPC